LCEIGRRGKGPHRITSSRKKPKGKGPVKALRKRAGGRGHEGQPVKGEGRGNYAGIFRLGRGKSKEENSLTQRQENTP